MYITNPVIHRRYVQILLMFVGLNFPVSHLVWYVLHNSTRIIELSILQRWPRQKKAESVDRLHNLPYIMSTVLVYNDHHGKRLLILLPQAHYCDTRIEATLVKLASLKSVTCRYTYQCIRFAYDYVQYPYSKVHEANMGTTWILSTQMGPMLASWTLLSG